MHLQSRTSIVPGKPGSAGPSGLGRLGALVAALLVTAACGGTDAKPPLDTIGGDNLVPPELTSVETTVAPLNVLAGGTVEVTCQGKDQYDVDFDADLTFDVTDSSGQLPDGVTIVGNRITAIHAGSFQVKCLFAGPPVIDDISPTTVTVQAGEPSEIKTTLFLTTIKAGTTVSVGCSARDGNGNIATGDTTVRVTPVDGTTVDGRRVTFTKTGEFEVVCMLADASIVGGDAVTVTVEPAALYELKTVLSTDTIEPGAEVTVTCPGLDRFQNVIDLDKVITLPVAGLDPLDGNRLRLTSTRAGSYPVTCAPKEAWIHPATTVPATLVVKAGAAAALALDLSPDRTVYNLGSRVKVTPRVSDSYGNVITTLGNDVVIDGWFGGVLQQTVLSGERIDLDQEGEWTLRAHVADTSLEAERVVLSDGSAPTIDLTFPTRGQMVTSTGSALTITGKIKDATGGLASVRINGAEQPVTMGTNELVLDKAFSPQHGVNRLSIEATDVNGNVTKIAQSFLVAPGWKPASDAFSDGIIAHLAKAFLDDGNRSGAPNDLATIMERFIGKLEVESYIPSPVVSYSGYDVYLRSIDYDAPKVSIAPGAGVLNLTIEIDNLSLDVYADGFIDVDGTVTADKVTLQVVLAVSVVNGGTPKVTAQAVEANIDNLNIDVNWAINWLIDLYTGDIEQAITSAFEDTLRKEIPPIVEGALKSLQITQGFEIPSFLPGGSPLPVQLAAKPDHTKLDEQGLDLALGTKVTAATKVPWATLGSFMRGGCFGQDGGTPSWDASKKLTMGISLDVVNQILHSVWQGGALEVVMGPDAFGDVDLSQYGVSDLSLTVSGRLPPILTDCLDQDLHLQLGELQIDASLSLSGAPLVIGMIVAFETTAQVGIDADNNLTLALGTIDPANILIDVTRLESELFTPDQEDVLVQLIRDQLLSKLLAQLAGQTLANFPIPEIDLGALDPSLAGQKISLHNVVLARQKGYMMLQGDP
ncbi:MAG: hypothetical protein U1F43_12385 [Myxococcota bacterium]